MPSRWGDRWRADVGDLDGNGVDDIVFNLMSESNVTVLARFNRDGAVDSTKRISHSAARWAGYHRFIADVDGDGREDVIWNDVPVWANRTYVARSQGDRLDLLANQDHPVARGWGGYASHIGDVNADGRSDLIWIKPGSDSTHIYLAVGQSDAQFRYLDRISAPTNFPAEASADGARTYTGDFNGDGRTDLLIHSGGHLRVMRATGGNRFAFDGGWIAGPDSVTAIADIDGDGRDDIVWMNGSRALYVALAGPPS
jgi:hypothetical protein